MGILPNDQEMLSPTRLIDGVARPSGAYVITGTTVLETAEVGIGYTPSFTPV